MNAVAIGALFARPLPAAAPSGTRPWWDAAFVFVVLFAVTLAAYVADDRVLNGISVWTKPIKFQASLALHFATLALIAGLLPEALRRARRFRIVVEASAAAGLLEIAYIMLQAARGRASHFNDQTVFEIVMYGLMGFGSLLLVAAPFAVGVWLMRQPGWRSDPLRLAVVLGLIVSAVGTLLAAGYMSTHGSHWVGSAAGDGGGLPVLGWSLQVGDLRAPHFFATHAMQILPLAGFVLRDAGARGCRLVLTGSALYTAVTGAVFVQALMGHPFISLSGH